MIYLRIALVATVLAPLCLLGPARADVTIVSTTTGKGIMSGAMSGEWVTRIKGGRMRGDSGDQRTTSIIDLDAQTMMAIDHKAREVTVTSLQDLQAHMQKITDDQIRATVTPTGKRRQVAGERCEEHQIEMTVPANFEGGPAMTVTTSGPFCIVRNAPGRADYAAFYLKAAEKGFIVSGDPRQARAQPGQARSMTELYRQMARLGVPYAMDVTFKIGGEGPMAAMGALMGKMGGFGFTSTVTRVSTEPVPADAFTVPVGYTVKKN